MTTAFLVDVETVGLTAGLHDVFEIAGILFDVATGETISEHWWWMPVDLTQADPTALRLNGYYAREPADDEKTPRLTVARELAKLTAGTILLGCNPGFDDLRLELFMREEGYAPAWHYRPFCIETAVAGHLHVKPGWRTSDDLSKALGVEPTERHTALGDCRWAKAMYDVVYPPDKAKGKKPAPVRTTHDGRTDRTAKTVDKPAEPAAPPVPDVAGEVPPLEKPVDQAVEPTDAKRPSAGNRTDGPPDDTDILFCDVCDEELGIRQATLSWSRWRRYLCVNDFKKVAT